jgi:THO complex subunit 5
MQSPDAVIDTLRQLATDASPTDDPASLHIRAGALFARLKALNRDANAAARAHKQITADARHDMDQTHLRLQNLLYEKRHLEREIEKCRQFAYVRPTELTTSNRLISNHNRLSFSVS